jgi:2-oxoglutarate ferredoxin oxidoreductase subunit alpha
LSAKVKAKTPALYHLEEKEGAETLIVTYGITGGAAQEAVQLLSDEGIAVSLLVARTLVPIPEDYFRILDEYDQVVFAEENLQGQFASTLFGERQPNGVRIVGNIGHMVTPEQIAKGVSA